MMCPKLLFIQPSSVNTRNTVESSKVTTTTFNNSQSSSTGGNYGNTSASNYGYSNYSYTSYNYKSDTGNEHSSASSSIQISTSVTSH